MELIRWFKFLNRMLVIPCLGSILLYMGYMGMGGPKGYGLKRVPILTTLAINYVRFLHDRSATSLKFLKKKFIGNFYFLGITLRSYYRQDYQ